MNSDIYDMDLFDRMAINDYMQAIRVPGGWIFESYTENGGIASTFVHFAPQARNEFPTGVNEYE